MRVWKVHPRPLRMAVPQERWGRGVYSDENEGLLRPWLYCTLQVYRKKTTLTLRIVKSYPPRAHGLDLSFRRSSRYWSGHAPVMHSGHALHTLELRFELFLMFNLYMWCRFALARISFFLFPFLSRLVHGGRNLRFQCKSLVNPEIAIKHILVFFTGASSDDTTFPGLLSWHY